MQTPNWDMNQVKIVAIGKSYSHNNIGSTYEPVQQIQEDDNNY